jgi:probable F420-dependent oxidoreductase
MGLQRPFRFGVYAGTPVDDWPEEALRAEALGYSSLSIAEHINTELAPISAMASAAVATSSIRIGGHTFANDFRNPIMLAREVASLDNLSDGRIEFGIGSGWLRADYDRTGIPFESPGQRLSRLFEAVKLIKRAFTEETVDFDGEHYRLHGLELKPKPVQTPWPPFLIGGGGKRVLEFAAREADIVGINFRSTSEGGFDWTNLSPEATAQKVQWVREAAGQRFPEIELNWLVPCFAITDDVETAASRFIEAYGLVDKVDAESMLSCPQVLIGTKEGVIEQIQRCREEYGVSYITVFSEAMDEFAPIVARLAGS